MTRKRRLRRAPVRPLGGQARAVGRGQQRPYNGRQTPAGAGQAATPTNGLLSLDEACVFLEQAEIVGCQALPWGSNYTYALALAADAGRQVLAIYKPRRGEVPLWDFPDGTLYRRERAAYLASRHLGWTFVPPTVVREGPLGIGSVQLFIDADPGGSFDRLRAEYAQELRRIAVFDCFVNNADRKASHFLLGRDDGRIWGIDHGLTFNSAPKLRTVVWDYCGEPIPEPLVADLRELRADQPRLTALCNDLEPLLFPDETEALVQRLDRLIEQTHYPAPQSRRYVPWPPF